jgi:hypothetical protein
MVASAPVTRRPESRLLQGGDDSGLPALNPDLFIAAGATIAEEQASALRRSA